MCGNYLWGGDCGNGDSDERESEKMDLVMSYFLTLVLRAYLLAYLLPTYSIGVSDVPSLPNIG